MFDLPTLPPLGTINGIPSNDTASPYYLPPTGYYQNDAGEVVSKTTTNNSTPVNSQTLSTAAKVFGKAYASTSSKLSDGAQRLVFGVSLEDGVFIVIGLLLLGAAFFSFKTTQSVVQVASKAATKIAEVAP